MTFSDVSRSMSFARARCIVLGCVCTFALAGANSHSQSSYGLRFLALSGKPHDRFLVKPEVEVLDFGDIPTNQVASKTLRLKNFDVIPRRLKSVRGKNAARYPAAEIPAGGTFEIECSMQAGMTPGLLAGKKLVICVEGQPDLVVPLRARAVRYVEIEPETIDLSIDTRPDLCLRSIDGQPFRIISAIPDCVVASVSQAKAEHVIMIDCQPFQHDPSLRKLVITLDHPKCDLLLLRVVPLPTDDE